MHIYIISVIGYIAMFINVSACKLQMLDPDDDVTNIATQAAIVGTVDWIESDALANSYEIWNANKVGMLIIPARSARCTGWLASEDILITNFHCIQTPAQAAGARVSFNFTSSVPAQLRTWYNCANLIQTWADLDITALRCSALNGRTPGQAQGGWLRISTSNAGPANSLYVIHQNCDFYTMPSCTPTKKSSSGRVLNPALTWSDISYDADTLEGSSGAPVFASYHHVVALHSSGWGTDPMGRGLYNSGTKASLLRSALYPLGIGWECNNGICDPNEEGTGTCPTDCSASCEYKCSDGVTCCGADGTCPDGIDCW